MRLICVLSLFAAITLGVIVFGFPKSTSLIQHISFIAALGIFVFSAVALIVRIMASHVEQHLQGAVENNEPDEPLEPH